MRSAIWSTLACMFPSRVGFCRAVTPASPPGRRGVQGDVHLDQLWQQRAEGTVVEAGLRRVRQLLRHDAAREDGPGAKELVDRHVCAQQAKVLEVAQLGAAAVG